MLQKLERPLVFIGELSHFPILPLPVGIKLPYKLRNHLSVLGLNVLNVAVQLGLVPLNLDVLSLNLLVLPLDFVGLFLQQTFHFPLCSSL